MSYPFNYRLPSLVAQFKQIRCMTLWAAGLGVAQSIIWMGLTITGILAYNCVLPAPNPITYGNLISNTFYNLYFRGDCKPPNVVIYNSTILQEVSLVQDPLQLLIWESVYLGATVIWLISSILLITHVKKNHANCTAMVLWMWITITFIICVMDLTLGIMFGIDYNSFHTVGLGYNFPIMDGAVDPNGAQLLAAGVVSISMMIVSLKGFVLWIINIGLVIYLIVHAIGISTERDNNDTLFVTRSDADDIEPHQSPINAYEEKTEPHHGYTNDGYIQDTKPKAVVAVELNQGPLQRAARISTDVTLQDRRFRNIDSFQQYPMPPVYQNSAPKPPPSTVGSIYPVPDYSPPMVRRY